MIEKTIAGLKVGDDQPVRIMGVINLSKESFYKNSIVSKEYIRDTVQKMIQEGADIIDIGARSTWPLAAKISKEEERSNLIPAIEALGDITVPISVDTMFSDIAEDALDAGAGIINDVSGFTADVKMAEVAARYRCPVILMASNTVPGDPVGMDAVIKSLERIISHAQDCGISPDSIIIDPAIGKWTAEKLPIYDFETIDNIARLKVFNKPILAAISRKSFIGDTLNKPASERLFGSLAAAAIAVRNGAHIIRTHDIAPTVDAVRIAEASRPKSLWVKSGTIEAELLDFTNVEDSRWSMMSIGATSSGSRIMMKKTLILNVLLKHMSTTDALIIKQEMLARGGDAALPRDAVSHETPEVDLIISGTYLQFERFINKIRRQVRQLPTVANMLTDLINMNSDAISKYSRYR